MNSIPQIPYCGNAPLPGHVAWNTDPILITALLLVAVLYLVGMRERPESPSRLLYFGAGWLIATLALVSPLCSLSVALFSARIGQHVILTTLATPLLVLGGVERIFAPALQEFAGRALRRASFGSMRALPAVLFAIVMWFWHAPALYDATFQSTSVYWVMHVSIVCAASIFWWSVLRSRAALISALSAIIITMLQMSLLGALLTFARRPLFAVHSATTWSWGLSPLQDQQLGGLITWVIGGALIVGWAAVLLTKYLMQEDGQDAGRFAAKPQ